MYLLAVNGRKWTADLLYRAIDEAKQNGTSIDLLMENAEFIHSMQIDYRGGRRYPHLVRDETRTDFLSEMLRSRS
jgi:hypothetical protein